MPKTAVALIPRALRDPRSRDYAMQTMQSLKRFLQSKSLDAKAVEEELQRIIQYKHWEVCGFKNLDRYLQAEVGTTHKQLSRRLAQDLAADPVVTKLLAKPGRPPNKEAGKGAIGTISRGPNHADYLVRRLKRDAPDIATALASGEYRSARAAAIAAGIVKVLTPFQRIKKLLPKLTSAERAQLRRLL